MGDARLRGVTNWISVQAEHISFGNLMNQDSSGKAWEGRGRGSPQASCSVTIFFRYLLTTIPGGSGLDPRRSRGSWLRSRGYRYRIGRQEW